jgi:4-hydroxybenzoate polyprenyltransferase
MLIAAGGLPDWQTIGLILLCMVFARTAAMCFNRLADWEIDKRNPRTADRHKLLPRPVAIALLVATSVAFLGTTWFLNPLCFWLSPVALVIVFFYSLTKRFTSLSHFYLGLALSVSPVGAWLAVLGHFDFAPLVLAFAVLVWVAGFDLIYATQDHEFDRASGLRSLVVRVGVPQSLLLAQLLHWLALGALAAFGWFAGLGAGYIAGLVGIAGVLVYEHRVAKRLDERAINEAFFKSNAIVGAIFLVAVTIDVFRSPSL